MSEMINVAQPIIDKACSNLAQWGFSEFSLFLIAKDHHNIAKLPSPANLELKSFNNLKQIIASSEVALQIHNRYFHFYSQHDQYIKNRQLTITPNLWKVANQRLKSATLMSETLEQHSIQSIVTWPVVVHYNLIGCFTLFSENSDEQMQQLITDAQQDIGLALRIFGNHFSLAHINELNPIENFNCMSERAVAVVRALAGGKTVEQIGGELFMTRRGVCYYIEQLKKSFICGNRYQLVDRAHKLGLL